MQITSDTIYQHLLFSSPVNYSEDLILYPIKMDEIINFNMYHQSIIVRKNSTFPVKSIIKMSYLEFLFYCHLNFDFAKEYNMMSLPYYFSFAFQLLKMVFKDQEVLADIGKGGFRINGHDVTDEMFDDFRRIIILQNGIDFDIDEFIHYDTEKELERAQNHLNKGDSSTLEDYIDSLWLTMGIGEEEIKQMPIRKFWRLVKRISKRDIFQILKSAESSGFVKLKEPVSYWMTELDNDDKYKNVKTSAENVKQMIGG